MLFSDRECKSPILDTFASNRRSSSWILDIFDRRKKVKNHELIQIWSAADLIVKSCHPIGRAGPTAVRDAVLVLKTTHLVFRGGIGGTLRTSLSLSLESRKVVCEYVTSRCGDRKGRTRITASRSRAMASTLSVHKRWQLVPTRKEQV